MNFVSFGKKHFNKIMNFSNFLRYKRQNTRFETTIILFLKKSESLIKLTE